MNDRAVSLLDQYEIEVLRTKKGRGAILCETNSGCLIFKEYIGNPEKINLQKYVLDHISEHSDLAVENILCTKEEKLFTEDREGKKYILKTYFENRECNINDIQECTEAVKTLANLHDKMRLKESMPSEISLTPFSLGREFDKHNRELRKVSRYIRHKSQKSPFETALLKEYDYFLEQALEIENQWRDFQLDSDTDYIKDQGILCHGDYPSHNIIHNGPGFAIINFERCIMDNSVRDLALFMRKLLEKNGWSVELGERLIGAYNSKNPMSARSFVELYYRLAYPEKFWKIVNFYFNARKAWIPERSYEKLQILKAQEKEKQEFLEIIFRTVS